MEKCIIELRTRYRLANSWYIDTERYLEFDVERDNTFGIELCINDTVWVWGNRLDCFPQVLQELEEVLKTEVVK